MGNPINAGQRCRSDRSANGQDGEPCSRDQPPDLFFRLRSDDNSWEGGKSTGPLKNEKTLPVVKMGLFNGTPVNKSVTGWNFTPFFSGVIAFLCPTYHWASRPWIGSLTWTVPEDSTNESSCDVWLVVEKSVTKLRYIWWAFVGCCVENFLFQVSSCCFGKMKRDTVHIWGRNWAVFGAAGGRE